MLRLIGLQIKCGGLLRRSCNLIHSGYRDELASALAVLEDAGDAEGALFHQNCLANMMSLARLAKTSSTIASSGFWGGPPEKKTKGLNWL